MVPKSIILNKMKLKIKQLKNLLSKDYDPISNYSNFASFIYHEFVDISWVGFYFTNQKHLYLGPFHGRTACVVINFDEGVCGASFSKNEPIIVKNVHNFEGHIACDASSMSELVIPINKDNKLIGVLDLDSYKEARFNEDDLEMFSQLLNILIDTI